LVGVHDIFHVSLLKKCLNAPMNVVLPEVAPLEVDLRYLENPIKILGQKDRVTRHKMVKLFKIQWSNHTEEEATWESEDFLRSRHPDLFRSNLRTRFLVRGEGVTPLVPIEVISDNPSH
jgi:hypothetical protein